MRSSRWLSHNDGLRGRRGALRGVLILAVTGCGVDPDGPTGEGSPGVVDTATPGLRTDDTDAGPTDRSALALPAGGVEVSGDHVATSAACAACHDNAPGATAMRDAAARPIAPFDLWQGSMMANASRDPLWRAMVSAEVAAVPAAAPAIEAKCLRCHAPLASVEASLSGLPDLTLDVLTAPDDLGHLARDGVGCTLCHQVSPDELGDPSSYSGGFVVQPGKVVYGPHAGPLGNPMVNHSGFRPEQGEHIVRSELCATCHELIVDGLAADGTPSGHTLVEQSVYSEWRASASAREGQTCAGCHLPVVDAEGVPIRTRIARSPNGGDMGSIQPREPFGRHLLVGGNTLIPQILRDQRATLRPPAPDAAFDATIAAARAMLAEQTASLTVSEIQREGAVLRFDVHVENQVGHRFPTGIPLRRAWLRVAITDADGVLRFASGLHDADGSLVDAAGADRASERVGGPTEPHHARITRADQVQIYETVLVGDDGAPVWRLLTGSGALKDNRLLPRGWTLNAPAVAAIAPVGVGADPDFVGGEDVVAFEVDVEGPAPHTVTVDLLFQPLGTRWARELFVMATPEALAFEAMWRAADRRPEWVAGDQRTAR